MIDKKNSNRTKLDKISKITFVYIIVKNKMFEWKYNAKDTVNTFQCYYC